MSAGIILRMTLDSQLIIILRISWQGLKQIYNIDILYIKH